MTVCSPLIRYLTLFKPYRGWVALSLLLTVITTLAQIGLLAVSGWFIAAMALAGAAGTTLNYFTPAAIIRALAITRTGGRYAERVITHETTLRMTAHSRNWFYAKLEPLAPAGLEDLHSADIFSRLRGDIDRMERFFLQGVLPIAAACITVSVVLAILAYYHPLLAVWEGTMLLGAGLVWPLWQQYRSRHAQAALAADQATLRHLLAETWQGMGELLLYQQAAAQQARIYAHSQQLVVTERRLALQEAIAQGVLICCMGLAVLGGIAAGILLVQQGELSTAHLAMLPLFCLACFDTVATLPTALHTLPAARAASTRLFALTDRPLPISGTLNLPKNSFQLHCTLPPQLPRLTQAVGFTLSEGETLAITGPSGVGKSSVIALLTGLLPHQGGSITLMGQALHDTAPNLWRAAFAVAEQQPYCFSGTVRDNLRLALPTASDSTLRKACALAHFSHPLDHVIGEHGLRLSGGERRRLALARALLKPAPCLILDEPTEGLDEALAHDVMQAILAHAAATHQAVLAITHQPQLLPLFNRHLTLGA